VTAVVTSTPRYSGRLRKNPRQSRAKDTRRKLLEAAAQLFADRGVLDTSTNRIASHAGVSIGTLYRYFVDRDEIADVLRRQLIDEIEKSFGTAALAAASLQPADSIAASMRAVASTLATHAGLARALLAESTLQGTGVPEFEPRLRLIVKTYLVHALGRLPEQDLETMAFVISNAGLAICYRLTASDAIDMDYEKVITETAAMIGAWLVQTARSGFERDQYRSQTVAVAGAVVDQDGFPRAEARDAGQAPPGDYSSSNRISCSCSMVANSSVSEAVDHGVDPASA